VKGLAQEVTEPQEKIHGLRLLASRYTPDNMDHFDAAVADSLSRTAIWKISIAEITGKRKKYDAQGVEMKFGRME
jgi:nitroimidazol reductase NimA-like FMN-containing flavoprotein (pyridoxamine 5'-phosphate oxidase superfamily)